MAFGLRRPKPAVSKIQMEIGILINKLLDIADAQPRCRHSEATNDTILYLEYLINRTLLNNDEYYETVPNMHEVPTIQAQDGSVTHVKLQKGGIDPW